MRWHSEISWWRIRSDDRRRNLRVGLSIEDKRAHTREGRRTVTCQWVTDFILAYQSGELPPEIRREFEHHLKLCGNCRRYMALYQAALDLGRAVCAEEDISATEAEVPRELIDAIVAACRVQGSR